MSVCALAWSLSPFLSSSKTEELKELVCMLHVIHNTLAGNWWSKHWPDLTRFVPTMLWIIDHPWTSYDIVMLLWAISSTGLTAQWDYSLRMVTWKTQEFYEKSSAECKLLDVVIVNLAVSLFCIALSGDCEDICRNFRRGITETESCMSSDSRRQLRRRWEIICFHSTC